MLGAGPGWTDLATLLPPDPRPDPTVRNAALASTFLAALELARRGACQLSQTDAFAPVLLRPAPRSAHP